MNWIRRYYLLTPLFVIADLWFDWTFRVSGLMQPNHRLAYYGFCLLCGLASYFAKRYTPLIAIAESSVNLLILLLGVMLPIIQLGDLPESTTAAGFLNSDNILNFILSSGILLAVFYSAQNELVHRSRSDSRQ